MSDPIAPRLREVVGYFLRLGSTAFGGPAAHIALMRHDLVERKGWLDDAEYAEMIALANLVPGPNSTEVAMHVGRRCAGTVGMIAAGVAFIAPAFALMLALGWAYTEYGTRPGFRSVLVGIAPVVVVLIGQAILQLGRTALRGTGTIAVGLLALAGAGIVTWTGWWLGTRTTPGPGLGGFGGFTGLGGLGVVTGVPTMRVATDLGPVWATAGPVMLAPLFAVFLQIGAVLYGSGYVLYALLEGALVHDRGWLTERQLLDAVAMGQLTPGPLFTTATFIGYTLRGFPGAVVATVGIFLPAFCFVGATGFVLRRLRDSAGFAAFLRGVVAASLALMVAVAAVLARDAFVDVGTVVVAVVVAGLLWWRRPNPVWLILAGGSAGALVPGLG